MATGELGLICSVDGCEKSVRGKTSYCYAHYMKAWRYGTPTPQHAYRGEDVVGQRFGTLTVLRRESNRWRCRCDCGAEVLKAWVTDLKRHASPTCGSGLCRRREIPTYVSVHLRLAADRGPASSRSCVDCGRQARHWSYDHADPDELISDVPATLGIAFSADPEHYLPRCVSCHKSFDLGRADAAHTTE